MKQFITQDSVRQANASAVLALIKKNEGITRREIESLTGFSWGAVSEITRRLTENGYILEKEKVSDVKNPGRTPSYLEINGGRNYAAGIEISIKAITAVIVNFREECVYSKSFGIERDCKDAVLKSVFAALDALFGYASGHRYNILGICVAMQGAVDKPNGVSVFFPSCNDWNDVPLVKILEERYAYKFYLEHDPNCILYGEMRSEPYENAVLVRVGEGIGMAAVIDGKIFSGKGMLEIGHTTLVPDGLPCVCGNRGCAEAYISNNGIISRSNAASLDELYGLCKAGNPEAVEIFEKISMYLGIIINNIVKIFNPHNIILCGSMMKYLDTFIENIEKRIHGMSFKSEYLKVTVIKEENAAFGAAAVAVDESIERLEI